MTAGIVEAERFLALISEGMNISFIEEIETVILGPCSSKSLNLQFWHHHLDGVQGKVLVVTECCGQYGKAQMETLRDKFPNVTFVAPEIKDYFDLYMHRHREVVRDDLLQLGVIKTT